MCRSALACAQVGLEACSLDLVFGKFKPSSSSYLSFLGSLGYFDNFHWEYELYTRRASCESRSEKNNATRTKAEKIEEENKGKEKKKKFQSFNQLQGRKQI
jgi:hypothetical protein